MEVLWKSLLLVVSGVLLLRISGRKSISQMTIAQTVVMISIGSIIIQPIVERSVWRTIVATAVYIGFLIIAEYLQMKFNSIENFLSGKAQVVIQDGQLVPETLKKMRFTVDQLEMRLRQQGIAKISDVKTATLEANGQLGYELMRHAKPVTIGELEKIIGFAIGNQNENIEQTFNIFDEVKNNSHIKTNPDPLH